MLRKVPVVLSATRGFSPGGRGSRGGSLPLPSGSVFGEPFKGSSPSPQPVTDKSGRDVAALNVPSGGFGISTVGGPRSA
eukprot:3737516-Heterocapsa_arctica.AAC.1